MTAPWVEQLPAGWRAGRLDQVATAWTSNVDKHSVDGQIPVRLCNYTDVYKNDSIVDSMEFMAATATPEQVARFRLSAGDTVITKDSETADDIGVPAFVRYEAPDLVCGYHLAIVRPNDDVHSRYLYWVMGSQPTLSQWAVLASGVTRVGIRSRDLAKVAIPVPPLPVQRAIADFLDREAAQIDELVAEQGRLIALLRERRTAVIAEALAPNGEWTSTRIKHVAHTSLGKMLDAGRARREHEELAPYVRAADVLTDGTVNLAGLNEMPFSREESARLDLCAGDMLLIEGGATVGRPAYLWTDAPGIAFQKTVNRVRAYAADPRFLFWSLLGLYESKFYGSYYGSVSFAHLTAEKLRDIPLRLPVVAEQQRIASHLDLETGRVGALIAEAENLIELARERRAALVAAVVTGQVDVRSVA